MHLVPILKRFSRSAQRAYQPDSEHFPVGGVKDPFKAGDLGTLKVGADNTVIVGPPTEFDANNIDKFNF